MSPLNLQQAIASVARSLGMHSHTPHMSLGDEFIAQAMRRASFILSPCAPHELVQAVSKSLAVLAPEDPNFIERVETILDGLIAYGDILEMRADAHNPWASDLAYTLRAAPPSFVMRKNGTIALLGVAGDQISPLTKDLEERTIHRGLLRVLEPLAGEDLPTLLVELGVIPLSERTWLRIPNRESAASYAERMRALVAAEPTTGTVDGIKILDTSRPPNFYRDRWVEPRTQHSGFFVARRPQKYGAPIWCVAELQFGHVKRFKDLREPGDRLRSSDVAWRIQAAFDAMAGHPQQYRASPGNVTTLVHFFSPLPSWAERKMAVVGTKTRAAHCLFSYEIPNEEWPEERDFLNETLWMTHID
jgi:hypothetical protein